MNRAGQITTIEPAAGIPGGEVAIECEGFDTSEPSECAIWFGDERAPIVALSGRRVLAIVPELKTSVGAVAGTSETSEPGGAVEVVLESGGERSAPQTFMAGRRIAEDLHPVTSPAFDPDDGSLFVTRSGFRGEQLAGTL